MSLRVAGSLWSVAPGVRAATIQRLRGLGLQRLHWDTSDGQFAAAGGISPAEAAELTAGTGLQSEAHVMAHRSAPLVDAWAELCDLVVVHIESDDWRTTLDRIERRGATAGLAVSPATAASAVPTDVPVLCMSITPGQAGSAFDTSVLAKVAALRSAAPDRPIGVDGGVRREHAAALQGAGAEWLVVGTDLVFDESRSWADLLSSH